jgi:hypothetical protein
MGFEKEIIKAGTSGKKPTAGRDVTVHCTGKK